MSTLRLTHSKGATTGAIRPAMAVSFTITVSFIASAILGFGGCASTNAQQTSDAAASPHEAAAAHTPGSQAAPSKESSATASSAQGPRDHGQPSALERAVVGEINLARSNPTLYASRIYTEIDNFQGKLWRRPGRTPVITDEGSRAFEETAEYLEVQAPLPELTWSDGLALGARDHVRDQGSRGELGHAGSDRSTVGERVGRHGEWKFKVGETISYGASTAEDIVLSLIVDDGVADRGHREAIFDPEFTRVGVAYGYHHTYGHMCVITFAADYVEKADMKPKTPEMPPANPPVIER